LRKKSERKQKKAGAHEKKERIIRREKVGKRKIGKEKQKTKGKQEKGRQIKTEKVEKRKRERKNRIKGNRKKAGAQKRKSKRKMSSTWEWRKRKDRRQKPPRARRSVRTGGRKPGERKT
jgi:hypothetical protein